MMVLSLESKFILSDAIPRFHQRIMQSAKKSFHSFPGMDGRWEEPRAGSFGRVAAVAVKTNQRLNIFLN